ncbi:MAG: prepilin-type N-terminal cleavage/methylation domain-containing protein [bacterium]|nr:prepilin-type N-terminal cleavage/methylation domain-containing protein [bacterium]
MKRRTTSRGFTLSELAVTLAVLVILAGVTAPVYLRSLEHAEESATRDRLDAVSRGLVTFYRDHGRFPTGREGLDALLDDPGTASWSGPYLTLAGSHGESLSDARGGTIDYELTASGPRLSPAGFAGMELEVNAAEVLGDWVRIARREISTLNDAAEAHRVSAGAYPTSPSDLVPSRLGEDFRSDPWGRDYGIDSGRQFFYSLGADGAPGTPDDVLAPGIRP